MAKGTTLSAKPIKKRTSASPARPRARRAREGGRHHETGPLAIGVEAQEFLDTHPYLRPIVVEAPTQLRAFFPTAGLRLDVVHDPEEDNKQAVLFIRTDLAVATAFRQLQEFDAAWWLAQVERTRGDLCLTLEFE